MVYEDKRDGGQNWHKEKEVKDKKTVEEISKKSTTDADDVIDRLP